jgi:hypothetical protein
MTEKSRFRPVVAIAAAIALNAMACANNSNNANDNMPSEFAGAPGWVIQGCHAAANDDHDGNICGVGSFAGSKNISLARTAAMARGRTEIARSLGVKVKAMLKDYQSTTTGGEQFGTSANDEQQIVDVSKQITDMSLTGTEVKDTWVSRSGTYYALMVLDLERFENSVERMDRLDEGVRKAITKRAKESFGELSDEIDSERNQ